MHDIHCLYKEIRFPLFTPRLPLAQSIHPQALALKLRSTPFPESTPAMPGSGAQGKWMASTVKEKDITQLWEAGYLAREFSHQLLAKGQIVPTPEPHQRVVFIPHFVRGQGFPLHPFVCGLML